MAGYPPSSSSSGGSRVTLIPRFFRRSGSRRLWVFALLLVAIILMLDSSMIQRERARAQRRAAAAAAGGRPSPAGTRFQSRPEQVGEDGRAPYLNTGKGLIDGLRLVPSRWKSSALQDSSHADDLAWPSHGGSDGRPVEDPRDQLCSETSYLEGYWAERPEKMQTLDDVRKVWGLADTAELKCQAVDDPVHRLPKDPEYTARVLDVAKYAWQPASGCKKWPWTREAWIKRMLRSRAGLVFVGDSLTEHHYAALNSLVVGSDGLVLSDGTPDLIFKMWLNTAHPDAARIIEEAGVDPERAARPLAKFHRHHHILSRQEMDEIWEGHPSYVKQDERSADEPKWVAKVTQWFEDWVNHLAAVVYMKPLPSTGRTPLEEKSVIIFQLGPHWAAGELSPQTSQLNPALISNGYTMALSKTLEKVAGLPPDIKNKVMAVWRGNSPGDPQCEQYPGPENTRTTHFSYKDATAWQFNWNSYPEMNSFAASRLSYTPSRDPKRLVPLNPKSPMRYLDVWPMSVKRPDAHLKPAIDCMHYCMPSVPHEWMMYTWHLIMTDSLNKDYVQL